MIYSIVEVLFFFIQNKKLKMKFSILGQTHSFGLFTHCIGGSQCGRNLLPSFDEKNYGLCHNIKYHNQCILSNSDLLLGKCTCEKPSYINTIHNLLIVILILQSLFIFVNFLRLYRHYCHISCLNDIQLRLTGIISTLFSSLFLIIIIIQQNNNRLYEPLEYLETMRQHYSRKQIYSFSQDLELILKRIEQNLDINLGASYICIILILILTIISFFTSSTIEIKIPSTSDENEKKNEHHHILLPPPPVERFIPYEQIHFTRQTKV